MWLERLAGKLEVKTELGLEWLLCLVGWPHEGVVALLTDC